MAHQQAVVRGVDWRHAAVEDLKIGVGRARACFHILGKEEAAAHTVGRRRRRRRRIKWNWRRRHRWCRRPGRRWRAAEPNHEANDVRRWRWRRWRLVEGGGWTKIFQTNCSTSVLGVVNERCARMPLDNGRRMFAAPGSILRRAHTEYGIRRPRDRKGIESPHRSRGKRALRTYGAAKPAGSNEDGGRSGTVP